MSARNKWICAVLGCLVMQGVAAPISQDAAVERAKNWMTGNPVMSKASQAIESVTVFPDTGTYSVYVVQLAPKGFLILNSDDRLPLMVSFSAESRVNLTDDPQNALRGMLIGYCENMVEKLAQPAAAPTAMASMDEAPMAEDELYGPFLETSWNQSDPYNLLCPAVPVGLTGYGNRAPVGCVPTTYAQLMNYHRWPYYGSGSHSYTDSSDDLQGSHSADFSDPYDWKNMKAAHSTSDSQAEKDAIAELMVELGVATEVNYEAGGTSGNSITLGSSLGEYAYYGMIESYNSDDDDIITPLESELRAGFPCVVSYPGHAFVADGLMVSSGSTTYHFNMGWGGQNNGWYTAAAAPTTSGSAALDESITSFRPQLMAFPQTNSVSGEFGGSAEVKWILPKRLEDQVSKLTINQLTQQTGSWSSDASEITGLNSGWKVFPGGRSGDCWYGGEFGTHSMVLKEVFVPDASTQFTFWMKYSYLLSDRFAVSVSTDGGASYTAVFSEIITGFQGWVQETVSLAAYAGQDIRIKLSLRIDKSAYVGVVACAWLDDLAITSGDWYDWETFAEDTTLASRRSSEVTTVVDDCDDFSVFEVTSTISSYSADWAVSFVSGVGNCFYKAAPEYGGNLFHLTSKSPITPQESTRLLLRAKYTLSSDPFRVLVSTDRTSFTEVWSGVGIVDWGDISIDLSTYAGESIYIRLEYEGGGYYGGGGIWIDSISTQEVTNPEYEGQPIHYTTLTNLPSGTHTLAAVLTDMSAGEHAVGPAFTLTVSGPPDDGDGMPEAWETMYGLDTSLDDSTLDPDEDGFSNLQEYLAGTVPTNSSSYWKFFKGDGSPLPAFQGMENRLYTIKYCDNLSSNDWETLTSGIVGSNGLFEVSSYESVTNACRFYRVMVQEAE